jgi:hypothetical protein
VTIECTVPESHHPANFKCTERTDRADSLQVELRVR